MALTHPSWTVDTTFSAKNIATAASVYTFTAAAAAKIQFTVKLTNAAGNGDYVVYLKRQWLGTGTAAVVLPKATCAAATGETVIEFVSMELSVKATDVVDVMIDGLAGDTSVNGAIRISADNPSVFDAGDVTIPTAAANATAAAAAILVTPANKLATGAGGVVTAGGGTISSVSGSVGGDVGGKVLGGGSGVFLADGVQVAASSTGLTAQQTADAVNNLTPALASGAAGSIRAELDAIRLITDAIDVSEVVVVAAISGSTITILRGDTFSVAITGLGDLSGRTKLWWTVKGTTNDLDSAATVLIEETAGLAVLNGAAGTALNGSITVDSEALGNVTIELDEAATAALAPGSGLVYDVQMLTAAGVVRTLTTGALVITADVTRAIA